ncbi:hypothetical protein ACIQ7Q_28805 [Streptomyces sp. NPDC096176]|uniref:hypothetical protein n=1 Tax=Streptomyces sp. NPDC096176 TaxID=3366079 RepID=UPI003804CA4F
MGAHPFRSDPEVGDRSAAALLRRHRLAAGSSRGQHAELQGTLEQQHETHDSEHDVAEPAVLHVQVQGWTDGKPLRVRLNPAHGAELLALAERYELVWARTWKDEANDWTGPQLRLPEPPFIDWPQMHGRAPHGTFWKTQYILQYAALPTLDPTGLAVNWADTSLRRS